MSMKIETREQKVLAVILVIGVFAIIWGVSDNKSKSEVKNTPANQIENVSEALAFQLAAVETKLNNPPQLLVNSFDSILKKLAKKCPDETESQIANYIYIGRNAIVAKGISMTFFDFAEGIDKNIPEKAIGTGIRCAEIDAAFAALTIGE